MDGRPVLIRVLKLGTRRPTCTGKSHMERALNFLLSPLMYILPTIFHNYDAALQKFLQRTFEDVSDSESSSKSVIPGILEVRKSQ
jgi:hypothetical protein